MIIEYVPVALNVAANTVVNGAETESAIIDKINNSNWLVDGILVLGKHILRFIGNSGMTLEPIFVVVAIIGFFLIMGGFDKWGYKLTSGSIIGFIGCKLVGAIC